MPVEDAAVMEMADGSSSSPLLETTVFFFDAAAAFRMERSLLRLITFEDSSAISSRWIY
jgi:hypothetical protein